jgi:hypothetical protein
MNLRRKQKSKAHLVSQFLIALTEVECPVKIVLQIAFFKENFIRQKDCIGLQIDSLHLWKVENFPFLEHSLAI